jgi:hypothetical protein
MRRKLLLCLGVHFLTFIVVAMPLPTARRVVAARERASRTSWPTAVFEPAQQATGYATGKAVTLRRAPNFGSPVAAILKDVLPNDFDNPLEVSSVSGAFLHIRHKGMAGWASMREALPHTLAYVLDAKTGATIARLPVGAGQKDIVFSPDGGRALIYGRTPSGLAVAYEYNTKSYAPTRTISATGAGGKAVEVRAVFFGGLEQSLYAVIQDDTGTYTSDFAIVRVHEKLAPAEAPVFRGSGTDLVLSPDRRFCFILRSIDHDADLHTREAIIDVLDLRKFTLRNTIKLTGELASAFPGDLLTNFDGSELYLLGDVSRLRVLDALTGTELRQIRTGWEANRELSLQNLCAGGRSLLIEANGNFCEVTVPEGTWWMKDGAAVRASETAYIFDTGKARYGVGDGTLLYRFAADGKIIRKTKIRQPNLQGAGQSITSLSLAASPGGERLILFVSYGEEFCPC